MNSMEVSAPKEHKFGVHELSDVVFIVGKEMFHCHKMFLAARSDYFAAMFTSNFIEKDKKEVPMDANPQVFRWLMEILYKGQMTDYRFLLACNARWEDYAFEIEGDEASSDQSSPHGSSPECLIWIATSCLLELADRFFVLDIVRPSIDLLMVQYNQSVGSEDCTYCATKYLLSLHYKLNEYEAVNASSKSVISEALSELKKGGVEFEISSEALEKLSKRELSPIGSVDWRTARGEEEMSTEKEKGIVIRPKCEEMHAKMLRICYNSSTDIYTRGNSTSEGWSSLIYNSIGMMRKVEYDWRMTYLCRKEGKEGSEDGEISWAFDLTRVRAKRAKIKFGMATFHFGCVTVTLCADDVCMEIPQSGELVVNNPPSALLKITAKFSGGTGERAFQHAQIFRTPWNSIDDQLVIEIDLA